MPRPEEAAAELLREQGVSQPPVPVEQLASALGCIVSHQPFEDVDVSGLLFRDGERTIIGVNATQHDRRQRFTVAHEIGHLILHPGRPMILEKLVRVNLRDSVSSQATDRQEIEANQFAAALLMPREFMLSEIRKILDRHPHATVEECVQDLAESFNVSTVAMGYRLTNLGFLPSE